MNNTLRQKPTRGERSGLADHAYDALLEAIQQGTVRPGQRLLETQICDWLQISRTPVREALRRLQTQGLLEHGPGGGISVSVHDLRAVAELYSFRETLEGTAARLAAQQADPTEIGLLKALVRTQLGLPEDPKVHSRENKIFHNHLYQAAHNRFLLKSVQVLHESVALLGRTTLAMPGRIAAAVQEHKQIVAAIEAHDAAGAEEASRSHVRSSYAARVRVISEDAEAAARHPLPVAGSPGG